MKKMKHCFQKITVILLCTLLAVSSLFVNGEVVNAATFSKSVTHSGTCGKNVSWGLKDGILTISGKGKIDDFTTVVDQKGNIIESESNICPWEDYKDDITEVYVKDGVTAIGHRAFSNCRYLTKAVIGNTVKSLGAEVFVNDKSLTDLTLGNAVETIGSSALYGTAIKKLVLPASINNLTSYSLIALWKLEEIKVSGSKKYQSIDGALYTDNGKTLFLYPANKKGEYTIPSKVTKIEEEAFAYSSLTKIVIPDQVKEIGEGAFEYNEDLQTLIFGKGIKTIPKSCCYYDRGLTSVTIPEGVKTIESSAFWWCTSLKMITLPKTISNIGESFEKDTKVILLNKNLVRLEDGTFICGFYVNVSAKEMYKNAFEVLKLVNKERKKAGRSELVMDKSLLETAMMRGFENVIYWSHTRPSGSLCFSANSRMKGENIASWQTSPKQVMSSWMNSSGHRANILSAEYKSIGIGCVRINGSYYWVQCFGTDVGTAVSSNAYSDKNNKRAVFVKKEKKYYKANIKISSKKLKVGQKASVSVNWNGNKLTGSGLIIQSLNRSVCEAKGQTLIAKKAGTAKIKIYYNGYPEAAVTSYITVKSTKSSNVPKASIKKLTNKKGKKVIVQIKRAKKVKGYQIVYANNKQFKKSKKVMTTKTSFTIKKLKKGKTYYVKIRAYKKNASGKKIYGSYSGVKQITIKR